MQTTLENTIHPVHDTRPPIGALAAGHARTLPLPVRPPGERPLVVLLHSSGNSSRQWSGLVQRLQPRFEVCTVDLHGHGMRPEWNGAAPQTLADDAALVAPLLAWPGGVHVVGHSYGGAVALKLAALHTRQVRSVVAYEPVFFRVLIDHDPAGAGARDVVTLVDAIRHRLAEEQFHAAAQRFVEFWSGAGAWAALPAAAQQKVALRMPTVLSHFDALFSEPLRCGQMARLGMPTLLLTGERTVPVTQALGTVLRRCLPFARHEVLPAMGHMGPITHADAVNERIAHFLQAHALPRPLRPVMRAPV